MGRKMKYRKYQHHQLYIRTLAAASVYYLIINLNKRLNHLH